MFRLGIQHPNPPSPRNYGTDTHAQKEKTDLVVVNGISERPV